MSVVLDVWRQSESIDWPDLTINASGIDLWLHTGVTQLESHPPRGAFIRYNDESFQIIGHDVTLNRCIATPVGSLATLSLDASIDLTLDGLLSEWQYVLHEKPDN